MHYHFGMVVIAVMFFYSVFYFHSAMFSTMMNTENQSVLIDEENLLRRSDNNRNTKKIGTNIINKAYKNSYNAFEKYCSRSTDINFKACMELTRDKGREKEEQKENASTITSSSSHWDWWFQTMLRDGAGSGIHLFFHELDINLVTDNTPSSIMRFCAIEKVDVPSWRKLSCVMNNGDLSGNYLCPITPAAVPKQDSYSRVVFLRDPLERFLLSFIAFCIDPIRLPEYKKQKPATGPNCEPNPIFHKQGHDIVDGKENKKRFFEAFVNTMPLKWNLFFYPQSLYCDGLYRHIQNYTFIGHMGGGERKVGDGNNQFYNDIAQLSKLGNHDIATYKIKTSEESHRLATKFDYELNEIFRYEDYIKRDGDNEKERELQAIKLYHEYYTPQTVKKVLQYMSIDYVKLNLPIPKWAEQMLLENDDDDDI